MSLSDLASIGSLVSGVAVLVSLVYLSVQVRQAEKNQRALMNQGTIARTTDFLMWYGQSSLIELATRVLRGATDLSPAEIQQYRIIYRIFLLDVQDHLVQRKAGLTDEITFAHVLAVSRNWMDMPLFRALWKHDRPFYAAELAEFVDQNIAKYPPFGPLDIADNVNSDLAQMYSEHGQRKQGSASS